MARGLSKNPGGSDPPFIRIKSGIVFITWCEHCYMFPFPQSRYPVPDLAAWTHTCGPTLTSDACIACRYQETIWHCSTPVPPSLEGLVSALEVRVWLPAIKIIYIFVAICFLVGGGVVVAKVLALYAFDRSYRPPSQDKARFTYICCQTLQMIHFFVSCTF